MSSNPTTSPGTLPTEALLAEIGHDRRLLIEAAQVVASFRSRQASIGFQYFQRKLRVGFAKAARLLYLLELCGVIGPYRGSTTPRDVLVKPEEIAAHLERLGVVEVDRG